VDSFGRILAEMRGQEITEETDSEEDGVEEMEVE
jgi:hypothetical protein